MLSTGDEGDPRTVARAFAGEIDEAFKDEYGKDERSRGCALFDGQELLLGDVLAEGHLHRVHILQGISLLSSHPCPPMSIRNLDRKAEQRRRNVAQRSHEELYAIKSIHPETLASGDALLISQAASALVSESKILDRLLMGGGHPNVCNLYGKHILGFDSIGMDEPDGYFIIVDGIGESLNQRFQAWKEDRGYFSERLQGHQEASDPNARITQRLEIALEVCAAMIFLAKHRIIFHLNVEKVGFDRRQKQRVKLFNFGCSAVEGMEQRVSLPSSDMRKRLYLAPECLVGDDVRVTVQSDVFSVGMIFWEFLTLKNPLQDMTIEDHLRSVINGNRRPPMKKVWSRRLCNLMHHCWQKNPQHRPSINQVYDELEDCLLQQELSEVDQENCHNNQAYHHDVGRSAQAKWTSAESTGRLHATDRQDTARRNEAPRSNHSFSPKKSLSRKESISKAKDTVRSPSPRKSILKRENSTKVPRTTRSPSPRKSDSRNEYNRDHNRSRKGKDSAGTRRSRRSRSRESGLVRERSRSARTEGLSAPKQQKKPGEDGVGGKKLSSRRSSTERGHGTRGESQASKTQQRRVESPPRAVKNEERSLPRRTSSQQFQHRESSSARVPRRVLPSRSRSSSEILIHSPVVDTSTKGRQNKLPRRRMPPGRSNSLLFEPFNSDTTGASGTSGKNRRVLDEANRQPSTRSTNTGARKTAPLITPNATISWKQQSRDQDGGGKRPPLRRHKSTEFIDTRGVKSGSLLSPDRRLNRQSSMQHVNIDAYRREQMVRRESERRSIVTSNADDQHGTAPVALHPSKKDLVRRHSSRRVVLAEPQEQPDKNDWKTKSAKQARPVEKRGSLNRRASYSLRQKPQG